MLQEYLHGEEHVSLIGIDRFKEKIADLEEQERKKGKNLSASKALHIIAKIKIMVDLSQIAQERHSLMILQLIPVVIIGENMKCISQLLCVHEMHKCIYVIHVDPVFEDPVIVKLEQYIKDLKLHAIDLFPSFVEIKLFHDQNVSNFSMKPVKDPPLLADLREKPFVLYLEHIAAYGKLQFNLLPCTTPS
ncbi:hypothetical protein Tco_1045645 [Tanacetum coccineum]|uniref:Uncharacterized protein n=1 Tax=Tanacetum coccineum TaxID=301880 RepID=A0ABQ5GTG5_9ASTR